MPKKPTNTTDADSGDVVKTITQPAPINASSNNNLRSQTTSQPADHYQYTLDLDVEVEKVVDGIEMGVGK